jgi:HD-like signal output (HDOD) protein
MHDFSEAEIGRLLKGLEIPTCPAVLAALTHELRKDEANRTRIARLISQDVALAAGVMKIANSPLFAPARQVGSIGEALDFLGVGNVFHLVVSELLRKALAIDETPRLERFWDSAAYTAAVCAQLALALPGALRDNAYCFGLFHDCAIPLLIKRFPDYRETLRLANEDANGNFPRLEETRHGTDHAVIGHLLARNWGLADAVAQAILCHHDYALFAEAPGVAPEVLALIGINLIAERVVGLHLRQASDAEWNKGRHAVAAHFGLSQAELGALVDDMCYQLGARKSAA